MADSYVVFGNPIKQSRSPFIHRLFAQQTGQHLSYEAVEAPVFDFAGSVQAFVSQGGKGANVTVPFKEQAFKLCDSLSERATKAGAVNTLVVSPEGKLHGDNTDGAGLVKDLLANKVKIKNAKVLLIGAGGAARGVMLPLLEQKPASLTIANRTKSKAEALIEQFNHPALTACAMDALQGPFDLIINSTSAGLSGEVPAIGEHCINSKTVCYDMVYLREETAFNRWSREQGAAKTIDGLGMLVGQAAESFRLWRGVKPDAAPVLAALRASL